MKIYYGTNTGTGPQTIWVLPAPGAKPYRLRHYNKHSPDGFQWGYAGSGPADAAFAILMDCRGVMEAERHHQAFKFAFIATAGAQLHIPEAAVHEWAELQNIQIEGGSNE